MKKTLLFIAIVLCASNLTFAQSAQPVGTKNNVAVKHSLDENIDQKVQKLTKALSLTAQQQTSVKQILTQAAPNLKAAKQAKDNTKFRQTQATTQQQIAALLNTDQKMKFDKMINAQTLRKEDNKKTKTN